jgi:DNA-binding transcriptional ArsR family regulator
MKAVNASKPIPMDVLAKASAVLRVLAHPHRLKIVELLAAGPRKVSELTDELGMAQNAVSQHLNFMKAHGILASRREGRSVFYEVIHPHARTVLACIRRNTPD